MSLKNEIFKQLKEREGEYVSGQVLAETFGVSRAAVWKAIDALRKEGYALSGTPKAGYVLSPSDVLREEELSAALEEAGINGIKLYVFEALPSTNAYAEKLVGVGASSPAVVAADRQTRGRARRGGSFPSVSGGLYMSVIAFPCRPPAKQPELTAKIYTAVKRVLHGDRKENEIFVGGKKACGILTECVCDPDEIKSCIAGIGVYPSLLPEEVKKKYPTRSRLCAAICKEVLDTCKNGR